jgi:hypothetical protein
MSSIPSLNNLTIADHCNQTEDGGRTNRAEKMEIEPKRRKINVFHVKKDIRFVEDQIKINKRLINAKKAHHGQDELIDLMQKHQTNLIHYHKRLCERVKAAYDADVSEMTQKTMEIESSNV